MGHYATAFAARDPFVRRCGIECVALTEGAATLTMRIADEHLNFNGTGHGGAIFTLADSAFGVASNSRGPVAAGIDAHIAYHLAVAKGDVLTAQAYEVSRNAKLATYRVDVTRQDGAAVASFTGTVFVTQRRHAEAS